MARKLVFDAEKITETKGELEKLEESIHKKNEKLMEKLEKLKKDWNTPAGKAFFKKVDFDWQEEVEDYCETLQSLSEMLDQAASKYQGLEEAIGNLKLG